MAERIESHVTVIYELVDLDRIERVAAQTAPLRLLISQARRWDTGSGGIYLDVRDPYDDLLRFRERVLGTAAEEYRPHVTLLHQDSVTWEGQVEEAWAVLRECVFDAAFVATQLTVHEQLGESWREAARLHLAS